MTATAPATPRAASTGAAATPTSTPPLPGFTAARRIPTAINEPIKSFAPGSSERAELKARLASMSGERADIPAVIGGEEIRTGHTHQVTMPHAHQHVLADYHQATAAHAEQAIARALEARTSWANWSWEDRCAVFLRAIDQLPVDVSGVTRLFKAIGIVALVAGIALLIGALSGARDPLQPLRGTECRIWCGLDQDRPP